MSVVPTLPVDLGFEDVLAACKKTVSARGGMFMVSVSAWGGPRLGWYCDCERSTVAQGERRTGTPVSERASQSSRECHYRELPEDPASRDSARSSPHADAIS